MEPKSSIQLILGSNGSGKSSTLREISPLPSPYQQYEKDGYKLLEFTHRGHSYRTLNQFDGKSGKYSLTKDGEELFDGSTVTDFRALIKREFGLTPEIQSLIDGVTRFSTMDVAKRRQWFTALSKTDYSYAIQYYGKLRSRIRDLQGALTISQNRLASEASKLPSETEIHEFRAYRERCAALLTHVLENKPRIDLGRAELETILVHLGDDLYRLYQSHVTARTKLHYAANELSYDYPRSIDECRENCFKIQGNLEQLKEQQGRIQEKLNRLLQYSEAKEKELAEREEQIGAQLQGFVFHVPLEMQKLVDVESFKIAFDGISGQVDALLEALPDDSEFPVSLMGQNQLVEKGRGLQVRLSEIQSTIQRLEVQKEKLEYAKQHHQRTCPACQHSWYHGYSESQYATVVGELRQAHQDEESCAILNQKNTELLSEFTRVLMLRDQIGKIRRHYPQLSVFWDELAEQDAILRPKKGRLLIVRYTHDLPLLVKRRALLTELIPLQARRKQYAQQVDHPATESNDIREAEEQLVSIQDQIRKQTEQCQKLQRLIEFFLAVEKTTTLLENILTLRQQRQAQMENALLSEHLNRIVQILRQEISQLEYSISRVDTQKALIDQLKTQNAEYEEQIRLLKQAEQALSPSTGLIAKGLTGFINWFLSRMNGFVRKVWSYPLRVLPVSINEDLELEYKFPVEADGQLSAADVKVGECNSSTCEIFDLAFRVVAMECLGFKEQPLQLDEFGSSFDHHHRGLAFQIVTGLTASTDIPQIFLVSHAEQSYGSLKNADVTVLHKDNVVIPDGIVVNGQTYIG